MFAMFASQDWPAWGVLAISILGGGITMAWRFGRLEQTVKDVSKDLGGRVSALERAVFRTRNVVGHVSQNGDFVGETEVKESS